MRKRFNLYSFPTWLRNFRAILEQFILPLTIFQGIRTLFFPTTFDVFLLAIFVVLTIAFHLDWF
ncbi:hypothetical protein [Bacillus alveayuensis]|uniref:Membrane protein YszA n=1 Tax=Aeribacillus alveayuensis TaxID=279215 RepID=A0ABT9VJT1_9BACI|nr:hypothetical protein [Bacillus alveayuensis]MDQ0161179.1 hypothetical protein [Bacillus alveayuensis]